MAHDAARPRAREATDRGRSGERRRAGIAIDLIAVKSRGAAMRDDRRGSAPEELAMDDFVVCPKCRRHVKAKDTTCPFCKSAQSRTATIAAVAVGVGMVVGACSSSSSGGSTTNAATTTTTGGQGGGASTAYGTPMGGGGMGQGGMTGMGGMTAAYGPPPGGSGQGGMGGMTAAYGPPPGGSGQGGAMGAYGPPPGDDGGTDGG
jgi:hypothetical protein